MNKKKGADKEQKAISPWLEGVTGVTGVIPPGRRLSPLSERRRNKWSASGVAGVTPPGKLQPDEGPAAESAEKQERKRLLREKETKRALEAAKAKAAKKNAPPKAAPAVKPGRPTGGFVPAPFADVRDPTDLKGFLEAIAEMFKTQKPGEDAMENLGELIMQSRAPFEIAVAFTIISVLIGKDAALRRRYTPQLERGAKTFFNLAIRLNKNVKPPRGLNPETMDAIFYDLPATAFQVPYAFATDSFCRMIELLRGDEDCDRALVKNAVELRERYIDKRSIGDQSLSRLFVWKVPDWAPED